jgi:hypothetical protein
MIAKGEIQADSSYRYTCGNCNGNGRFMDGKTGEYEDCPHCYNLDYDKLIEAFRLARGERYYAILKAILSIKGKAIVDSAIARKHDGKLFVADLLHLLMEFKFPRNRFKPLVEWLEETHTLKSGVYELIHDSKFKISDGLRELGYEAQP